jgi:RNA polymerase sigma factor (sigma-70 family)
MGPDGWLQDEEPMARSLPPTSIPDYQLLRRLGKGAFGDVWLGQHLLLREFRAIKLVAANGQFGQAELDGVRTYMQMARQHPHLVPIEHLGQSNGHYFLVMPLADDIKGPAVLRSPEQYEPQTLKSYLELHRPLPIDKVLTVARHLLSALEFLHGRGLIHCDVKPDNVLRIDGSWRLGDMSILIRRNLLKGGRGTPWFTPPEGNRDRTGDLYALGKILFLLATPFDPARFGEFMNGTLRAPGSDPRCAELQAIIQKACADAPGQRFLAAGDMHTAVRKLVQPTLFELRIDEDFAAFTAEQQGEILSTLRQFGITSTVQSVRPGSVILTLKLMPEDGERLLAVVRGGHLGRFRVLDAHFIEKESPRPRPGPEATSWAVDVRFQGSTLPVPRPAGAEGRPGTRPWPELPGYEIFSVLGQGGMGVVYKARQTKLNRVLALKTIRGRGASPPDDQRLVQRFRREARILASLSHPNIVQVFEFAQVGQDYVLATEYVEGIDLQRLVQQTGPLPVAQACELARQMAEGLAYVHKRGLIHRDIKPSNVMLAGPPETAGGTAGMAGTPPFCVKILDFGVARLHPLAGPGSAPTALTSAGEFLGTPAYAAPEQMTDARAVDARADLYSLGCTLYYLLTARPPFPGVWPAEHALAGARDREPVRLSEYRADVPEGVAAIVRRLLSPERTERYQTAAELAKALEPWAAGVSAGLTATAELPALSPDPSKAFSNVPAALAPIVPGDPGQGLDKLATVMALLDKADVGAEPGMSEGLEQFLKRYSGAVRRYLLAALRDPYAADDLFQEFCLRILGRDFKSADLQGSRFREYLQREAHRLVIDYLRRPKKQTQPLEPEGPESAATELDAERAFRESWREELLRRAWQALEEDDRKAGHHYYTVLRLRAEQPGLSSADLAEELGRRLGKPFSAAKVRRLLSRARNSFTDLLVREVSGSLGQPSPEGLREELIELNLLSYCEEALKRAGLGQ